MWNNSSVALFFTRDGPMERFFEILFSRTDGPNFSILVNFPSVFPLKLPIQFCFFTAQSTTS